ncbi:hypothetical protein FJNA_19100 [Thermus sp. FJN-A]
MRACARMGAPEGMSRLARRRGQGYWGDGQRGRETAIRHRGVAPEPEGGPWPKARFPRPWERA